MSSKIVEEFPQPWGPPRSPLFHICMFLFSSIMTKSLIVAFCLNPSVSGPSLNRLDNKGISDGTSLFIWSPSSGHQKLMRKMAICNKPSTKNLDETLLRTMLVALWIRDISAGIVDVDEYEVVPKLGSNTVFDQKI